jgi:hypothetical protein
MELVYGARIERVQGYEKAGRVHAAGVSKSGTEGAGVVLIFEGSSKMLTTLAIAIHRFSARLSRQPQTAAPSPPFD